MRVTDKQRMILEAILAAADDGRFLNLVSLVEVLPYQASRQAVRCSLKFLEKHGMLVVEKAGREVEIKPKPAAYALR